MQALKPLVAQTSRESVAERIREARQSIGLTQRSAAESLGVSKRQFMRYELGQTPVSEDTLIKLGSLLQVEPAWLLTGRKTQQEDSPSVRLSTSIGGLQVKVEVSSTGISIQPEDGAQLRLIPDRNGVFLTFHSQ
jgi:transcriptional regulator with XRE-family HTH domain